MKKYDVLVNQIANLSSDAKKALAANVLAAEENRLRNSIVPLNADHEKVVKEEKTEKCFELVAAGALVAGTVALGLLVVNKLKKEVERQAAKEKARLEAEKKEMIQTLSRIKGRH